MCMHFSVCPHITFYIEIYSHLIYLHCTNTLHRVQVLGEGAPAQGISTMRMWVLIRNSLTHSATFISIKHIIPYHIYEPI